MDLYKTTESFKDIVLEYVFSLILIPRTLYKVLRSPLWATDYVVSESGEAKKRYEKYSSPIWFWLVIGILSYYSLLEYIMNNFTSKELMQVYDAIGIHIKIGGFIVFFISIPLSCAFVIQLFKYKRFEKSLFAKTFYVQCYITAPLQMFYIPGLFIDEFSEFWAGIAAMITLSIVIWFLVAEVLICRKELKCGWLKALGILILMYCSYWVFAIISFFLFLFANMSTLRKIVDAVFAGIEI